MNAARRKTIQTQIDLLNKLKEAFGETVAAMQSDLEDVSSSISDLESEEQDAFDNLPEGLQQADKGQAMEETIDKLSTAQDDIDQITQELTDLFDEKVDEVVSALEEALA